MKILTKVNGLTDSNARLEKSGKIQAAPVKEKVIGIVGGMGPMAGVELVQKILSQTKAAKDQDHLPIILMSLPNHITDRTSFLLGKEKVNPANQIADIIEKVYLAGANTIGIACNTSCAPEIFGEILKLVNIKKIDVKIFHIINEVVTFIEKNYPDRKRIGILSTKGLFSRDGYVFPLVSKGFDVVLPDKYINHNFIHKAIYDPRYGIKSRFNPVTPQAIKMIQFSISHLLEKKADAIVLGCTELSLAIKAKYIRDAIIIDPLTILARSLIKELDESKLLKENI